MGVVRRGSGRCGCSLSNWFPCTSQEVDAAQAMMQGYIHCLMSHIPTSEIPSALQSASGIAVLRYTECYTTVNVTMLMTQKKPHWET